ncbi:CAP domain-containing protein [Oscillibacter sp.]|uniref:CAP domain-containing protein n=1 Tax=Oscillibacter sp. TaxID=1945593 RepID=UPI0028ADA4C2|nr:CAP domain-containing protein [Oscillibacter sp.]
MKKAHKLWTVLTVVALAASLAVPAQATAWEKGTNSNVSSVVEEKEEDNTLTAEEFSAEVLRLVNEERTSRELEPFETDAKLAKVAAVRAKESATKFAHERPDGRSVSTAFADENIAFVKAGENLAKGQKTPDELVKDWMESKTHRANILSEKFTIAELGFFKDSAGKIHTALMFLAPSKS